MDISAIVDSMDGRKKSRIHPAKTKARKCFAEGLPVSVCHYKGKSWRTIFFHEYQILQQKELPLNNE